MRSIFLVSLLAAMLAAQPNTLTPQEISDGWILLFDGDSMFGWTSEGKAQWQVRDGAILAEAGEYGWLRHSTVFADFVLKCEFRSSIDGNSGIFLRSAKEGQPHLTGYELQIYDKQPQGFHTGSLVGHINVKEPARITGGWQSYEAEVQGNHFLVKLDGKTVLYGRDSKSASGHIGLQFNPGKKIEFRSIKLKPLGMQPIFNGRDLNGWQVVDTPRAKEKPVWAVQDGMIHVEKGPGQLETSRIWGDFVLQLDIRANASGPAHHPNSGVFFRGDPGGFWTGYESQIRNEYRDGDRTKPVDFGTGGVYHYQPARKVVSNDNEFFTKTIAARGRHIAVWINGYPVSDYEDARPEGANARQQARLSPGVISLQAHDPTTNLDFRKLRIIGLP